jgi:uncharacterized protein DUF6457
MTREEWLRRFCERIGVDPPDPAEVDALLRVASTAAHSSERPAAPLACWAIGRSSRSAAELEEVARAIAAED